MNLGAVDIVCLVGYMAGIGVMGMSFAKRNVTTEDYFVGGRSHKGWVIGLSLVGTSISSISFLGFPADAFKTAYLRMVPNFMLPIALVIAAYVFLPFFRKNHISSAYEYLEMRFGPGVRVYGAVAFVAAQLVRISGVLFLVSVMLKTLTGLDLISCIIIAGVFVGFYTIVGGIHAVIWTDVIQTIVLVLGGAVCLLLVINRLPGGFAVAFARVRANIQSQIDVEAGLFPIAESPLRASSTTGNSPSSAGVVRTCGPMSRWASSASGPRPVPSYWRFRSPST